VLHMADFVLIFGSIFLVSIVSLLGIIAIGLRETLLKKILLYFVSFSVGTFFGSAFIHLIPEAIEKNPHIMEVSAYILAGLVLFFIIEKIIRWHHCHKAGEDEEHVKSFTYMNLIGDAAHNFMDGMIIAGAYMANTLLGITTTIAVLVHEIPQELGDFAILIHGGFGKRKALIFNFLSALTAFCGAIFALFLGMYVEGIETILVPVAAGGFIYIAGSDLVPELHKRWEIRSSITDLIMFILGILVMYLLLYLG